MSNLLSPENRILVVDDDVMLNDYFGFFLESKGMISIPAYSLKEAVDVLKNDDGIDLILLDYQLGDGVGVDFLKCDSYLSYNKKIPVIMVSSNESPEFLEVCFDSGISDYVIKPVNLSLLSLKIQTLLTSVKLNNLIFSQKKELEIFKKKSQREEAVAKFTYEYLIRQNSNEIPGIKTWLKSCSSFSGDMTLAKLAPNGNLYFMLADATGHGLSAAITIMPVVSIFNSMVSKGFNLQQIVAEINKKVLRDTPPDRFVAAIVIELHREKGEISIWNGGMPAVFWYVNGELSREFSSKNMAFGILEDRDFDVNLDVCQLKEKGHLFLCSDGLLEQRNNMGTLFSLDKLKNLMSNVDNFPSAVVAEFQQHAGVDNYEDDVSICLLDFSEGFGDSGSFNPDRVFNGSLHISPFTWSMKLHGKNIAGCDLPPLFNSYLQGLGFGSDSCQKIFLILSEMLSNAIDHGVLKLSSELKSDPEGFVEYFSERELRLGKLKSHDFIKVEISWNTDNSDPRLVINVQDSGVGYEYTEVKNEDKDKPSGRGISLINRLSSSVEVIDPGNIIRVTVR